MELTVAYSVNDDAVGNSISAHLLRKVWDSEAIFSLATGAVPPKIQLKNDFMLGVAVLRVRRIRRLIG